MTPGHALQILADVLRPWATSIAARYGHPVYLVGSALDASGDDYAALRDSLRDVDVVCVLPDAEFANRFGGSWVYMGGFGEPAGRWAAEVGKLSRNAAQHLSNINIDFKVQSEEWVAARHAGQPRLRIDSALFDDEGGAS